jgi:hypothetical protein
MTGAAHELLVALQITAEAIGGPPTGQSRVVLMHDNSRTDRQTEA